MPQVSISLRENTIKIIKEIAKEDERSFSETAAKMLTTSAAQWIVRKSKPSKSIKK